jgi:hypothetical protein
MMLKTLERSRLYGFIGLTVFLLVFAGCTGGKDRRELSAGTETAKQHAMFDRDSRNNEDPTLGVKAKWLEDQGTEPDVDIEDRIKHEHVPNRHTTRALQFAPEISGQLERVPGIKQATVLLTEENAYAAIVTDGHDADTEGDPAMTAHQITPKGGVGLFGTGTGIAAINWRDPGGLGHAMSARITGLMVNMLQSVDRHVFVSANPHYVRRIRFYENEGRNGADLATYLNEFNTMNQHVFPTFSARR